MKWTKDRGSIPLCPLRSNFRDSSL